MKMVTVGDRTFPMEGYIANNLDFIKDDVKNDNDAVIIVDGKEGSGKSVFAMTCAYYMDPTLTLERVCFNPDDFKKQILKAKPLQAVIFDEAITGLRARRWASMVNNALIEMLAQIRQKNLIIIMVIPSFFELEKYISIHRSVALLHVYRKAGKRGYYRAYSEDRKATLYMLGRKAYNYNVVMSNFHGDFGEFYPVDEQTYRKKKLDALTSAQKEEPKVGDFYLKRCQGRLAETYEGLRKELGWGYPDLVVFQKKYLKEPLGERHLRQLVTLNRGVQGPHTPFLD